MRKIYFKLIAISLTLALSMSVVVMSSYAWFVLSESPAVTGIRVAIGGGNTIMVAADLTETVDGVKYHYPDTFSDKLNFGQHESYSYLNTLGGLTPVSTADGVHWFMPAYYDTTDEEVRNGKVPNGQLKDVSEFIMDSTLSHANLPASEEETITEGSYIFLDFWVVSPETDSTLHLSTGDDSGGSFLIDLLQPTDNGSSYSLSYPENTAAAAARVGFLANPVNVIDDTMLYYQKSASFDERFTLLRGTYLEPGNDYSYEDDSSFMIYEPNGDYHPETSSVSNGDYVPTRAVGLVDDVPAEVSVMDRVTVQQFSSWARSISGLQPAIEEIFQTTIYGKDMSAMNAAEISEGFYSGSLQGQISPYADKGRFFARTADLESYKGLVDASQLEQLDKAGATDDVYIIKLERNVPQRIRMFIWLEGQDVDCDDTVRSASFALNIELAGSTK